MDSFTDGFSRPDKCPPAQVKARRERVAALAIGSNDREAP